MKEHIEIEYKILISQELFQIILKDYQSQIQQNYFQTNYYFTHPLLTQKKMMLRIREKKDQLEMTLKRPYQNHRLETNIHITQDIMERFLQHQDISNEIVDILKSENIDPAQLQQEFSLTTHRYDIPLPQGLLSLDENVYLDQYDYELEFEVNHEEEGYKTFLDIISPYQLHYRGNCLSKVQRAYLALKNASQ